MRRTTRAAMLVVGIMGVMTAPAAAAAVVPPDVQAVGSAPAPVPPEALAPHPDFSVALAAAGHESPAARVRVFSVKLRNVAGWTATSVRACVSVSGSSAQITGVKAPGSQKQADSACWQFGVQQARVGHNPTFRVKTKRPISARTKVRATVTVTAGNANPLTKRFRLPIARRHAKTKHKRGTRRSPAKHVAVAAQSTTAAPVQTASCLTGQSLGIAFVADDSGSMATNDPDKLRGQAISVGLDQMPDGAQASATSFDDYTRELFPPTTVDGTTRPQLKTSADRLFAGGGTDYQLAFQGAQDQLAAMSAQHKAVIFLSDGAPNDEDFTTDRPIAAAGTPIFTIGFGEADKSILAGIAARSGGQTFSANSAADLESIFAHVVAILTCAAPSLTASLDVVPGTTQTVPFAVGLNDGEFRALASWSKGELTVTAVRPKNTVLTPGSLKPGEAFSDNPTYALISATNPAVGGWQLRISAPPGNDATVHVSIDVFDKGLAALPPQPPVNVATDGRRRDPCFSYYGGVHSVTKKVFGGSQTDYDQRSSLYEVCTGFGQPEDLQMSLGMKCAFLTAATALTGGATGPAGLTALDTICGATDTLAELESGNWAGAVGSEVCQFLGSVFAEGVGIFVAGATAETGAGVMLGVLTYRALAAGSAIACGGLFDGGAVALGNKLEADHETHIARDIVAHGKCLRSSTRFGYIHWSAATCSV
jgi:Mg-chelatase subunit ChlD